MPYMNKAGKGYKKTMNESAIVMSKPEYQKLRDPRKRFNSQAEWDKFFKFVDAIKARMSEKDHAELQKLLRAKPKQYGQKKLPRLKLSLPKNLLRN
jgi:hypothetical protein